jgi:hypothetical protein
MWRVSFVLDLFATPLDAISPEGLYFSWKKRFCVCGLAVHVTNSPCPSTHYDSRLSKMFGELYTQSQSDEGRAVLYRDEGFGALCEFVKSSLLTLRRHAVSQELITGMRTIRNACAGVIDNVTVVIDVGVLESIGTCSRRLVLPSIEADEIHQQCLDNEVKWNSSVISLLIACCQALANASSSCAEAREYVWSERFGDTKLRDILAAVTCSQSDKALAALIAAIYNTVHGDSREHLQNMKLFVSNRALSSQLLMAVLNNRHAAARTVTTVPGAKENPVSEWMHMLVFAVVKRDYSLAWLLTLSPREDDSAVWTQPENNGISDILADSLLENYHVADTVVTRGVTLEQIIAIQLLTEVIEDPSCQPILIETMFRAHTENPLSSSSSSADSMHNLLSRLITFVVRLILSTDVDTLIQDMLLPEIPSSPCTSLNECQQLLQSSVIPLMQLVASALAIAPSNTTTYVQLRDTVAKLSNAQGSFLHYSNQILLKQCKLDDERPQQRAGAAQNQPNSVEFDTLLSTTLQMLSNLIVGCDAVKDMCRQFDTLPLLLHLSGTDFNNPLRREWALLCVRNVCEGHQQNQEYIQALTLQKVEVVNEELRAKGLRADVDPATGKIQFKYEGQGSNGKSEGSA